MIKRHLLYISISLLSFSCSTYTTFYSKTHQEINPAKSSKIYRLDLSNQDLEELPVSIENIKDLKMINLSNNTKLNIDNTLKKLAVHKNLEVLILDNLDIKKVPASIKLFPNLKQVSFVNNPNLNLQQAITQISELPIEFLNLKNNKLTSLPKNITKLQDLKDLNVSYNSINDPNTYIHLGKLPKLYSLWIDHNHLKILPKTIGELDQIRFLYVDHNELKDLPDQLVNMKKVWVIHAGYNKFTELPEVFTTMKALLMIHVNNNQIQVIPKAYETEKYPLAGLLLDNNPLPEAEKQKAKKIFSGFFLLSFGQKGYK
ncbi:hypothetical protein [uncultured Aquimarina sp.]|uniref:leucine-rich repeat domain-containing protein n=1 Tax=uncultured Aquimarina sp. TaxID=575652 RepID=UPI00261ECD5D|nr:hypothetical protein [uncultured Aquimarina sp.]